MRTSYQILKFMPEKRKRGGAWISCETCKQEFYVFPSRMKDGNPRFCSQKCYIREGNRNPFYGGKHSQKSSQNRNKFKTGKENPNFIRFGRQSGFVGKTFIWWRNYLMEQFGKCETCGFPDKRILEVHHKDRNRNNNTRENLILLCPNCHALQHWLTKSGPYKWMK